MEKLRERAARTTQKLLQTVGMEIESSSSSSSSSPSTGVATLLLLRTCPHCTRIILPDDQADKTVDEDFVAAMSEFNSAGDVVRELTADVKNAMHALQGICSSASAVALHMHAAEPLLCGRARDVAVAPGGEDAQGAPSLLRGAVTQFYESQRDVNRGALQAALAQLERMSLGPLLQESGDDDVSRETATLFERRKAAQLDFDSARRLSPGAQHTEELRAKFERASQAATANARERSVARVAAAIFCFVGTVKAFKDFFDTASAAMTPIAELSPLLGSLFGAPGAPPLPPQGLSGGRPRANSRTPQPSPSSSAAAAAPATTHTPPAQPQPAKSPAVLLDVLGEQQQPQQVKSSPTTATPLADILGEQKQEAPKVPSGEFAMPAAVPVKPAVGSFAEFLADPPKSRPSGEIPRTTLTPAQPQVQPQQSGFADFLGSKPPPVVTTTATTPTGGDMFSDVIARSPKDGRSSPTPPDRHPVVAIQPPPSKSAQQAKKASSNGSPAASPGTTPAPSRSSASSPVPGTQPAKSPAYDLDSLLAPKQPAQQPILPAAVPTAGRGALDELTAPVPAAPKVIPGAHSTGNGFDDVFGAAPSTTSTTFASVFSGPEFAPTGSGTAGRASPQDSPTPSMSPDADAALATKEDVMNWSAKGGRKSNLRALLSTFHTVLWPGSGWDPVTLADLVDVSQVKEVYHKAVTVVHPDKVTGSRRQELARHVFGALREAYDSFKKEMQQPQSQSIGGVD